MPSPCPAGWHGRDLHSWYTPRAPGTATVETIPGGGRGGGGARPRRGCGGGAVAVRTVTQTCPSRGSGRLRRGRSYQYRVVRPGRGAAPCRRIRGIPHSGSGRPSRRHMMGCAPRGMAGPHILPGPPPQLSGRPRRRRAYRDLADSVAVSVRRGACGSVRLGTELSHHSGSTVRAAPSMVTLTCM